MRRVQRFADLPVTIEQKEISVNGQGRTYGLLVPKTAAESGGYPIVLGLHYSSPTPGLSPYFGLGFVGQLLLPALQDLNAILVAPDAPDDTWTSELSEGLILAVLAQVKKDYSVDARKSIAAGFSMGGAGAWHLASRHAELFRGAIPIAAAVPPDAKPAMPVYVIHSRSDETAPFGATEQAVRALEGSGAPVTLVALDDAPHRDVSAYVDALHGAIPWIHRVWRAGV